MSLKHFLPGFVLQPWSDLKKRVENAELAVRCLEAAVDALVINPRYVPADEVGFNGQRFRKQIFKDILAATPFNLIVETGTWVGNTTGFMSQTARRPVYSCELSPRFHALAKLRLAGLDQIHLTLCDSRRFLQDLTGNHVAEGCVFFYLDAHWYDDLPLTTELEMIAVRWKEFVVMIDDFKVEDDAGYIYDDYGPGKALTLELLTTTIRKHELGTFFPAAPSSEETGNRRGCVVLSSKGTLTEKLSSLTSLRPWPARR